MLTELLNLLWLLALAVLVYRCIVPVRPFSVSCGLGTSVLVLLLLFLVWRSCLRYMQPR